MTILLKQRYSARSIFIFLALLLSTTALAAPKQYDFTLQPNPQDQLGIGHETKQLRIAQQYGLAYLPLMIMRQNRLIEKHVQQSGLGNIRVAWMKYPSGDKMNQALKIGFMDIASGGVVPMLRAWDKTRDTVKVKGIAAMGSMPLYLNSKNPKVKSVKDFTDKDRIALPAVKKSIQVSSK